MFGTQKVACLLVHTVPTTVLIVWVLVSCHALTQHLVGSSQEPRAVLEDARVRIIKAKVKMNSQTLRSSLVSEGITTLLVTGPHLKGKQTSLKCDCRCLFLPCHDAAAATNNRVPVSFSMDSRPGDDWVNRLSF